LFRNAELESELSNAGKEIRQAKEQANSAEQQLQEVKKIFFDEFNQK